MPPINQYQQQQQPQEQVTSYKPRRENAEEINRRWFGIVTDDEDPVDENDPEKEREAWEARRKAREEMDMEMEDMRQRVGNQWVDIVNVFCSNSLAVFS